MAATITRTPDLLDRLTKEVTPQGTVSYTYDNADRRETMTVAGQNAVNYTFDIANRLTQISQSGVGTVGFQYDNADRRTLLTLPDGVTQTYVYDKDSHVASLTYKTSGGTTIGNLAYAYDADGRRSTVGGSLASVWIPGYQEVANTFNADNEMTQYNGTAPALTYDADGQMTSGLYDTYTWDSRRHLSAISSFDIASFEYDALGRRVSKTINGTTTQFLYDGLNPIQELSSSKAVIANMLTGLNIDEYFERTEPACCGPLSYLTDALGSTQSLVDSSGTVQYQYLYDPFGNTVAWIFNVNTTNSYAFTGRENDGDAEDLYYYRGRYYNPIFQRFISQDPIDFAGGDANLYGYVGQAPTDDTDPSGQCGNDPCPPDKRRFFNWLDKPLAMMASNLETSKALLLALAAKEGGWTSKDLDYNMRLENPFGVNAIKHGQAVGNIHYQSLQQATGDWEALFGDRISGDTVPSYFAHDLQHPNVGRPYNSQDPEYSNRFLNVYESVMRFMRLCGITW